MSKKTIIIIAVLLIIIFIWNRIRIKIESVCFDGDTVSNVTLRKGLYSIKRFSLQVGSVVNGYSLLNKNGSIILFGPRINKNFQKIDYYVSKNINPAE